MYRKAIVLGTMLVPTIGHLELIKFAYNIAGEVEVLIQGRSFEPVPVRDRANAIIGDFKGNYPRVYVHAWNNDAAPQNPDPALEINPGDDVEFWNHWANEIRKVVPKIQPNDVIVASEPYGAVLARYLGCAFMPFDIKREMLNVKGTNVRNYLYSSWDFISPTFRVENLKMNLVMFGQESVGKTTLARECSKWFTDAQFVPEYARGYLETVGAEITEQKMMDISIGQSALEKSALLNPNYQFTFLDTDILSTIGYYRIFYKSKEYEQHLYPIFKRLKKYKTYVLLPDDIPFEEDILRYGGDVRESTYQFWKDLLEEFECDYFEMKRGLSTAQRVDEIVENVHVKRFEEIIDPISSFKRD